MSVVDRIHRNTGLYLQPMMKRKGNHYGLTLVVRLTQHAGYNGRGRCKTVLRIVCEIIGGKTSE